MRVLVTGGLGFIGSHLVDLLVEKGYRVFVIDDLSSESSSLSYRNSKSEISVSTIEKSSFMSEKYDAIFHLAARARIQPSFDKPFDTIYENFTNALRVFQKAADDKSRIIFASTSSSQGGSLITPYTFSKVSAEDLMSMYNRCYGMEGTSVRFFNVYGPREPHTGEYPTVIAKFLEQYKRGEPLTVVGHGDQSRDFTHVSDICEGLFLISQKPHCEVALLSELKSVDLGAGDPKTIMEVVRMFHENPIEGQHFVHTPMRRNEPQKTRAEIGSLQRLLAWQPQRKLREYIEKEKTICEYTISSHSSTKTTTQI